MFRLIAAAILTLATALPLAATDLTALSDAERQSFRDEVRAYLLANPEVLMEAIQILDQRQKDAQVQGDASLVADNSAAIFDDGYSFVGGNPEGDVTIVEFLDYKCGYCKKAFPEVTDLIRNDGNIRFIVKEFPILGPQSELASRFAITVKRLAGDAAYAQIHDELMAFRGEISNESLRNLSDRSGLDTAAIMAGLDAPETTQVIAANQALAIKLQINGTPGFVFGNQLVRGYVPGDMMARIVADMRS